MNEELDKFEQVALRIFTTLLTSKRYEAWSSQDLLEHTAKLTAEFLAEMKKPEQ